MDAYTTQGAFSWNELMTSDPEAALAFYTQLLGWTVQKMAMPGFDYHVLKVGETSVGGIMALPPDAKAGGVPPNWGQLRHRDRRRCHRAQGGGTRRQGSTWPGRHPGRRTLCGDHRSAGRGAERHQLFAARDLSTSAKRRRSSSPVAFAGAIAAR